MPLVHVHGVATRPTKEYEALVKQRDALYRSIVFKDQTAAVRNPDWGSHAVQFSTDLPWLPKPSGNERFAAGTEQPILSAGLGQLATRDAEQAIDLVVMAALEQQIGRALKFNAPELAADPQTIDLAGAAADLISQEGLLSEQPKGLDTLRSDTDAAFAETLGSKLEKAEAEAFGLGDKLQDAVRFIGGVLGNGASDLALRTCRRDLSRAVSMFLGDVIYLGKRNVPGAEGTRERIFEPIINDLVEMAKAAGETGEPLIVVGHSLGGVILYDMLTDTVVRDRLDAAVGRPFAVDALFTVGSQPGFFADLGLYATQPTPQAQLPMPAGVAAWMNVFDFTDVFSFLCAPSFDGVKDFGYDTVVDLLHAHSAYFQRPSFYKRMRVRLEELGSFK
jgi:hypothetical protein